MKIWRRMFGMLPWMSIVLMTCFFAPAKGQVTPIPIGQLTDTVRLHPKPVLILISTHWCTYCRIQKAQLKKNKDFQSAAALFHFSELDAESTEDLAFKGMTYSFKPTGVNTGTHALAQALGTVDGRLAFPTWVLLDENLDIVFQYPGVLSREALGKLLDEFKRLSKN